MVRRRVLIAVAVVVIATTIVISMIAAQFLIPSGTDAKGGSYNINGIDSFPKNLVLRGTRALTYRSPYVRHLLIDKDTVYPNPTQKDQYYADRYDWEKCSKTLHSSVRTMYNKSFVYTKHPQKEYYIIGMPSVSLTFNVSVDGEGHDKTFEMWFTVSLWRISPSGTWDQVIDFGTKYWDRSVGLVSNKFECKDCGFWFSQSVAHPVWIGPNEKIALRITILGKSSSSGGCYVSLYHVYKMTKPNQFVVDLPIVEP